MDTSKSFIAKAADKQERWFILDAEGQILGRVASVAAKILRGKTNPKFVQYMDLGDHVIIVNAEKIQVTGKRLDQKYYRRHSTYLGGLKEFKLRDMLERKPAEVLELAIKGMLPKNRLGRSQLKKLRVYAGSEHTHQAQKPVPYELNTRKE